jgi:hypothetical protein
MIMLCSIRGCTWLILLLTTQLLLQLPSVVKAKGGGHGVGGGRGGGRRRRDPPLYKRFTTSSSLLSPHSNGGENKVVAWILEHLNPLGCHNVPRVHEVVSVLVNRTAKTYLEGNVTELLESGMFVVAVWYDIENDEKNESDESHNNGDLRDDANEKMVVQFILQGTPNLGGWFYVGFFFLWCWIRRSKFRELEEHEQDEQHFDTALAQELLAVPPNGSVSHPPISGSYLGFTRESDGSDQRIDVELEFGGGGLISGSGVDARDGRYTLKGNYSRTRVKWIERYKTFTVTVRGTYKGGRRFVCSFRSSRGVTGEVTLGLKKKSLQAPREDELRCRKSCRPD